MSRSAVSAAVTGARCVSTGRGCAVGASFAPAAGGHSAPADRPFRAAGRGVAARRRPVVARCSPRGLSPSTASPATTSGSKMFLAEVRPKIAAELAMTDDNPVHGCVAGSRCARRRSTGATLATCWPMSASRTCTRSTWCRRTPGTVHLLHDQHEPGHVLRLPPAGVRPRATTPSGHLRFSLLVSILSGAE